MTHSLSPRECFAQYAYKLMLAVRSGHEDGIGPCLDLMESYAQRNGFYTEFKTDLTLLREYHQQRKMVDIYLRAQIILRHLQETTP